MAIQRGAVITCENPLEALKKIYRFVRALKVLEKGPLYTREFLGIMSDWGDSFELLKEMERLGLIERYRENCKESVNRKCVYNRISNKGRELLSLIDDLLLFIYNDNICVSVFE